MCAGLSPEELVAMLRSRARKNGSQASAYRGVSLLKQTGKWQAQISLGGKQVTTFNQLLLWKVFVPWLDACSCCLDSCVQAWIQLPQDFAFSIATTCSRHHVLIQYTSISDATTPTVTAC